MKQNIFSKKNQLDEMQEQTLRKIESRGFWLMWWGLFAVMAHRQANQRHHVQLFAGIENLNQPILGAAAQCFLQKQIAAGIAGQGKLRQAEQFGSGNSLCAHGGNDLLRIVGTVSNMQRRADGCCVQKSIFHG